MPRRGRSANRVRGEELRVRCGESLIEPDSRDLVGGRILLEEGTDLLSPGSSRGRAWPVRSRSRRRVRAYGTIAWCWMVTRSSPI